MKLRLIFWSLFFLLAVSCTKEIPFDFNTNQFIPELVVNGLLTPDSSFTVFVHQTSPLDQVSWIAVSDAEVTIMNQTNNERYLLEYMGDGRYEANNNFPIPGNTYELIVEAGDLGQVSATDTVPISPTVYNAKYVRGKTFDVHGDPHIDISVEFENNTLTSSFYEIIYFGSINVLPDSGYSTGVLSRIELPDPILQEEGNLDFDPKTFVFSNKLIESEKYTLKNKFIDGVFIWGFPESPPFPLTWRRAITFRKVSYAYYKYQKAWTRHRYTQPTSDRLDDIVRLLFSSDPLPLYSNIEGGHGIFASYTSAITQLQ